MEGLNIVWGEACNPELCEYCVFRNAVHAHAVGGIPAIDKDGGPALPDDDADFEDRGKQFCNLHGDCSNCRFSGSDQCVLEWAGWMPREFCSSWGAYGCKIDDDLTTVSLGRKEADVRWASTLVWVC